MDSKMEEQLVQVHTGYGSSQLTDSAQEMRLVTPIMTQTNSAVIMASSQTKYGSKNNGRAIGAINTLDIFQNEIRESIESQSKMKLMQRLITDNNEETASLKRTIELLYKEVPREKIGSIMNCVQKERTIEMSTKKIATLENKAGKIRANIATQQVLLDDIEREIATYKMNIEESTPHTA
jgi:predicted metal-dependent hydrolase